MLKVLSNPFELAKVKFSKKEQPENSGMKCNSFRPNFCGNTKQVDSFSAAKEQDVKKLKKACQFMTEMGEIIAEDQKRPVPVLKSLPQETMAKMFKLVLQGGDKPTVIGVAGGSASGKTTIQENFVDKVAKYAPSGPAGKPFVQAISHDMFYYDFSDEINAKGADHVFKTKNLDCPDAVETSLLVKKLEQLKAGEDVKIPKFNMNGTGIREDEHTPVKSSPLLVIEGLFTLGDDALSKLLDLKVFVDASKEVRAERWWARAEKRNMRKGDEASEMFFNRTFTMHDLYVEPTKKEADIVISSEAQRTDIDNVIDRIAKALTSPVSFAGLFKKPDKNKKAA